MKNFSREEFIETWKEWGIKNGIYAMYAAQASEEAEKRWSEVKLLIFSESSASTEREQLDNCDMIYCIHK